MEIKKHSPISQKNDIQNGDKITVAGSIPNRRSSLSNIAIPSEENIQRAREWVQYNKL